MTSDTIRQKYLNFFKSKDHAVITPAPLVLEGDPTTLFTSAGMQPLTPFLKGEKHPQGKRLVDIQPSIRLGDIEEVGDNRHTTFFEMLGNWSLGDYFKESQLPWIWEFFTKELGLEDKRLFVTVFEGSKEVSKDEESYQVWKSLGIPDERIFFYGVEKNWWSRSGTPDKMPAGEIGGPDSEVFYDFGEERKLHENSPFAGQPCHPNCDCGRYMEIGNSVFIQYEKLKNGSLKELPQKNVDFGGGLERIVAVLNGDPDMFLTDLFFPIIARAEEVSGKKYVDNQASFRVVADHLRAATNIIQNGVVPGNKLHGYILRRLIRRSVFHLHSLGLTDCGSKLSSIAEGVSTIFPHLKNSWGDIAIVLDEEGAKFEKALTRGTQKLKKAIKEIQEINGKTAFDLYQTEGFPLELTLEILEKEGIKFSQSDKEEFQNEFEKHKEMSRSGAAGIFKGGLADKSEDVTKLHTATHLLHSALRKTLGEHVSQKGSNINAERLRFDFSHPEKLTEDQINQVEELINQQIEKDLRVNYEEKSLDEAKKEGALAFFGEKYGERVKVYSVGNFSKEVCGGPHVASTGAIGHVRILKQEKVGSGIVRIYATHKPA